MFHVIIVHPTVSVTMKDLKKNNKIWDGSETHVIIRVTLSKSRIKIENRSSLRKKSTFRDVINGGFQGLRNEHRISKLMTCH